MRAPNLSENLFKCKLVRLLSTYPSGIYSAARNGFPVFKYTKFTSNGVRPAFKCSSTTAPWKMHSGSGTRDFGQSRIGPRSRSQPDYPTTLHALLARTCFFSRYRKNSLLTFANSRRFLRYRRIDTVIHPLFVDRASRKPGQGCRLLTCSNARMRRMTSDSVEAQDKNRFRTFSEI